MDYEKIATGALNISISKTDRLSAFINDGDKEPSWDGCIYLHKDKNRTKEDIKRIPVQVKGKGVSSWNKDKIPYSISHQDLTNYLNDGGTVFFVVYIDKYSGDAKRIYYSSLLPKKIQSILDISKGKNSTSVTLYTFPENNAGKMKIFLEYQTHREMQAVMISRQQLNLNDLMKEGQIENFTLSFAGDSSRRDALGFTNSLFKVNELYVYANIRGINISYPIHYIANMEESIITQIINKTVSINNTIYYSSFITEYTNKACCLKIGKSVIITFTYKDNENRSIDNVSIKIKIEGYLRERVKDLEFVLDMIDKKEISIDDEIISVNVCKDVYEDFDYNEYYKTLRKYVDVLDILNVSDDLNFDICNEQDVKNLDFITDAIIGGKPLFHETTLNPVMSISIANLKLAFAFLYDINEGNYIVKNFFDCELLTKTKVPDSDMDYTTSQFMLLKSTDYINISNLNIEKIISDLELKEINDYTVDNATLMLLEILKAYDVTKSESFYQASHQLALWILEIENISSDITFINMLQIKKRKESLLFVEKEKLYAIINKNDAEIKIAALLLLDEVEEAIKIFYEMNHEMQIKFKDYPIAIFFNGRID